MTFVTDLDNDEIRDGFLVTSDRKRLWNAEIELIVEFARVCDKHNLKFWASCGTLLGAARHNGFIPWDDDVDINMPRSDYEKLKKIAPSEFRYPYYFDLWYNNEDLPPNSGVMRWSIIPFAKLRNSRTIIREFPNEPNINQGIFIDIFPMIPLPPFEDLQNQEKVKLQYKILRELFMLSCKPKSVRADLKKDPNRKYLISRQDMDRILNLPLRERGKILEDNLANFDYESKFCSTFFCEFRDKESQAVERKWFAETIYLPFEGISIPAPKDYDKILTSLYGDWKKFVPRLPHAQVSSTMISSKEYFKSQK